MGVRAASRNLDFVYISFCSGPLPHQVLDSARQLSAQAECLRGDVEKFLNDVRAA